ncbi:MAG: S-methyl-5-thioribose-1-phosphate isomerase [Candidatus Thermoplasmatota archaeon]|nr:S-methyl-5-thioribose-1-phosphate isomerase [Candidatus Thermoplasmatota archaeon]
MRVAVGGNLMDARTVSMEEEVIKLIDQRLLPGEFVIFEARDYREAGFAITEMVVRGAPAIGATAAYAMAQAQMQGKDLEEVARHLRSTRPTGHDLFYAIELMLQAFREGKDLAKLAEEYAEDSVRRCRAIGRHGLELVQDGSRVLTHCNAGALATVDYGTALAPIRAAKESGREVFVFVDETRPRLQGARLTAWELAQEGIEHAIIADNAAGLLMARGEVDLVIVGADRVASNGDVANKIGTYEKAVLAKENGIPFYVAAPVSTFDFSILSGAEIPIEERNEQEIRQVGGELIAPEKSRVRNPAFDVTPVRYIAGFITEVGILKSDELSVLKEEAERSKGK